MKTKETHTPGPWNWGESDDHKAADICPARGEIIARVNKAGFISADVMAAFPHEANARLIAAAPEMMLAIQSAMRAFADDPEPSALSLVAFKDCKRALALATGGDAHA